MNDDTPGPWLLSYSSGAVVSLVSETLIDAQREAEERCKNMKQSGCIVERATYRVICYVQRLYNGDYFASY